MNKSGCVLELMVGMLWFGSEGLEKKDEKSPVEDLTALGFSFYKEGNVKEAINYFKQALHVKKSADLYNNLGFVYLHDGKYAKAFNAFRQALHIDGGYLPAFYNLGMVMYYGKSYQDAINIFTDVINVPELDKMMLIHAHNDQGCAYKRAGKLEEAIKSFETAIVLNNTFDRPYANLGNIYCEQGKFDEALTTYEKALKANENCASAYNGIGVVYVEKRDFDKAKTYFDKALIVDKHCQAAYINKIILEKKNKESNPK